MRNPPATFIALRRLSILLLLALAGCGGVEKRDEPVAEEPREVNIETVHDAVPRPEPLSRYGNPDSYVVFGQRYEVMKNAYGYVERGIASWYGPDFHGKRASSGERYDMYQMTAAHKTLPIPCYVEVTNLQNGRKAVLRVNDRGPFKDNRIIDLSYVAARKLGIWQHGTGLVEVRVIDPAHPIVPADRRVAGNVAQQPSSVVAARDRSAMPRNEGDVANAVPPFYVQVGAFAERFNAERLRERLLQVRQDVHVSPAESAGLAVYRVQIGPFTSIEASDRVVDALHSIGIGQHRIVTD